MKGDRPQRRTSINAVSKSGIGANTPFKSRLLDLSLSLVIYVALIVTVLRCIDDIFFQSVALGINPNYGTILVGSAMISWWIRRKFREAQNDAQKRKEE